MTNDHYILHENGSITIEPDLLTWARWYETAKRHVGLDELPGGITVSTVFLGRDHNYDLAGPPILFETMIFGGNHDQYQKRYSTRDEAVAGHAKALALAKSGAA